MKTGVAVLMTMLGAAGIVWAQGPYAIDWYSVDGGGGTSSGGAYTLSGSIGQPEAGAMTGGGYILEGGFWPAGLLVPGDEGPTMVITLLPGGTSVRITWDPETPGFVLERTPDLSAPSWSAAPAGDQPVTGTSMFYRLKK